METSSIKGIAGREDSLGRTTWVLCVLVAMLGLCYLPTVAIAQSVTLDSGHVKIESAVTGTVRVDIGPEVIVEGEEIRVLKPGPDLQVLINSLTASANTPYVIRLGPGVYTLTSGLVMKPYVSLVGSGENMTLLKAGAAIEHLVESVDDVALTDMTIRNEGGHASASAIYNNSSSPWIARVTAQATGVTNGYGLYNASSSSPDMSDVTATGTGATLGVGVYNNLSSPVMRGVTASGSSAGDSYGVHNVDASPVMTNVDALASGGTNSYGVFNGGTSSPLMTVVHASASGASNNYGVYNDMSSSVTMVNNEASASGGTASYGVYNNGTATLMTHIVTSASGGTSNFGVYNNISSSPIMVDVSATASGGTESYGVYNLLSSPTIKDSILKAESGSTTTAGINIISLSVRMYNTIVVGGVGTDNAATQCINVYDGSLTPIGC